MFKLLLTFVNLLVIIESKKLYRVPLQRSQNKLTIENYQADYYCTDIYIGHPKQKIRVLLDTGSANLYVPSVNCNECPEDIFCHNHNQYNESKSLTSKTLNLSFEFPGTSVGHIVADTILIGDVSIAAQPFAAITKTLRPTYIQAAFDGIFGLGLRKLARDHIKPPFYNIFEQNLIVSDVFSFYLKRNSSIDNAGYLILGGSDVELYKGEMIYAPLINDVHWQIALDNIKMSDEIICVRCNSLIDTGSVNIAVPGKAYRKVLNRLAVDSQGEIDCRSLVKMPTLQFGIGNHTLELEPKDYVLEVYRNNELICLTAFVRGGMDFWILGDIFIRKYLTEFDKGNMRIGFAEAV